MRVGIIGAGKWGMNHVRTAVGILGAENVMVYDVMPGFEKKVLEVDSGIKISKSMEEMFVNESVIVATPAETHYEIAKRALENGCNVLVEKPITLELGHAEELNRIAIEKKLILMVGHVLLFHPAVIKMKVMIEEGKVGKLQYIYSNRLNLGTIRSEENILWSFAPHDISVIQYLTGSYPEEIFAKGGAFVQSKIEDSTITYLKYPGNVQAHIFVSWLHPFKEQRMVVIGEKGMLVFEDSLPKEKLKYHRKGFHKVENDVVKFDENYEVVGFEAKPALREEQIAFYRSVETGEEPVTNGKHAIETLKVLMDAGGQL